MIGQELLSVIIDETDESQFYYYIDLDGVVIDLLTPWLALYYDKHPNEKRITPEDIVDYHMDDLFEDPEYLRKILTMPELYELAVPFDGALDALEKIKSTSDNYMFVTTTEVPLDKWRWLLKYSVLDDRREDKLKYLEIRDKKILHPYGVLFEDSPWNLFFYQGIGVRIDQPYNRDDLYISHLPWADTFADAVNMLPELKEMAHEKYFRFKTSGMHPTEIASPVQTRSFRRLLTDLYNVHLEKNADYSPANILGTGEPGLVTRQWDKMARMFSLLGWKVDVNFISLSTPKEPKNESLDDTIKDKIVYGIIHYLYRHGQWGK